MSGPENVRGIDYQISATCLLILHATVQEAAPLQAVRIDSRDDESEDLEFTFADGRCRQVQLKKLMEGYNWTPSRLRPILASFASHPYCECMFVTDGSIGADSAIVKPFLEGKCLIPDELFASLTDITLTPDMLKSLVGRTRIKTRYYPSADAADPAAMVRQEVELFLIRGPFTLTATAAEVASRIWGFVFAAARSGAEIDSAALLDHLRQAGLQLSAESWTHYPTADVYYPHSISIDSVSSALIGGELLLITGIGGTGKTTLVAESAARTASQGRRTCWVSLNELLEPSDAVELIADYCRSLGFTDLSVRLRELRPHEYPTALSQALTRWPISIAFDRFEATGARLASLIQEVIQHLPAKDRLGSIVLTSRYTPSWWHDIEREKKFAKSVSLGGLPLDSAKKLLSDTGVGCDETERSEIVEAVCGLPQSLVIMQQVFGGVAPKKLKEVGVEEARDWLHRRVLDELAPEHKSGLARLSVLEYAASRGEALAVIGNMGPDILSGLVRRDLARVQGGLVTVHDALRQVAVSLLTRPEVAEAHRAVADHLLRELQMSPDGELLYETGIKWAAHLEATSRAGLPDPEFEGVLKADVQLLRDLFAISTRGFPYEFEDESLVHTWSRVQSLIDQGLVKRVIPTEGEGEGLKALTVEGLTEYQRFLAECRCLLHGYASHVGYMGDFRFNYSYEIQGLSCPWEHCIELLPVPPVNDEDYSDWIDSLQERFSEAEHSIGSEDYCEYLHEFITDASSPEVIADHGKGNACPIYGHWCPGGREQSMYCQSIDGELEDNAADDEVGSDNSP